MERMYEELTGGKTSLCVIGMGYVGLPIAVAFSRHLNVIGFDINETRLQRLRAGDDVTGEVEPDALRSCRIRFTSNEDELGAAGFFIVAVPTPINENKTPDLQPLISASTLLGRHIRLGSVVVYESTVYPGLTEEVCVPILERESGLTYKKDFRVGYSPERINPGDRVHRLETIVKIVSGCDEETRELVAKVYELVVKAGVYRAESIMVAEAAKVIENAQRDINIAFMNELSIIFHKMGLDTRAVLRAAGTKWNFLDFQPGIVGGHCIGVDPYYLTYQAQRLGYHSEVILAGRRINDNMGAYIAGCAIKQLAQTGVPIKGARIGLFGFTFKEDCPDVRNTRVIDIARELREYRACPVVFDPIAEKEAARALYGVELTDQVEKGSLDAVIVAVAHRQFREWTSRDWALYYKPNLPGRLMVDVKGIYDREPFETAGFCYWRL